METANVEHPAVAGQMTAAETQWCKAVKQLLENTLRSGVGFKTALQELYLSFHFLRKHGYDLDAAPATVLPDPSPPPTSDDERKALTETEIEFFRDALGLIDFATRNGVDFRRVLVAIGHDVNALHAHYDSDLQVAAADCFSPMVSGWSKRNESVVGEADE